MMTSAVVATERTREERARMEAEQIPLRTLPAYEVSFSDGSKRLVTAGQFLLLHRAVAQGQRSIMIGFAGTDMQRVYVREITQLRMTQEPLPAPANDA